MRGTKLSLARSKVKFSGVRERKREREGEGLKDRARQSDIRDGTQTLV